MNQLDIQIATVAGGLPDRRKFQQWVDQALADVDTDTEIVIRIVDAAESAELNEQYRHKQGPTNILSFPFEAPPGIEMPLLGDLLVCAPVVAEEARQQQKKPYDHWAHIVVHGVLHLLGYDHIEETQAERMEALEIKILQHLNIQNPYLEDND
ncbi:rRNA maturation RNase YbeY [Methylomarinum sp. Ch1-1]|uniref:Endoribonuclease YbeY n=1 Tax=Methylomarinum roseum TaxID=3067653 RepID=A0AAU7NTW5_9GAMM